MTEELPTSIAGYFAADRDRDATALALLFTEDAVVEDGGQVFNGRAAIQRWMGESWTKYRATTEPFAIAAEGPATVVTSHVAGDFPGSPVDLRFRFVLAGEWIARLEVTP